VAQIQPQAMGSLFVASYDSQGYGGGNFYFFYIIYKDSVRTSQETYYFFATETIRLMMFRETIALYFENRMKHTFVGRLQSFNMLKRVVHNSNH
jgi:hypothetical protein